MAYLFICEKNIYYKRARVKGIKLEISSLMFLKSFPCEVWTWHLSTRWFYFDGIQYIDFSYWKNLEKSVNCESLHVIRGFIVFDRWLMQNYSDGNVPVGSRAYKVVNNVALVRSWLTDQRNFFHIRYLLPAIYFVAPVRALSLSSWRFISHRAY